MNLKIDFKKAEADYRDYLNRLPNKRISRSLLNIKDYGNWLNNKWPKYVYAKAS